MTTSVAEEASHFYRKLVWPICPDCDGDGCSACYGDGVLRPPGKAVAECLVLQDNGYKPPGVEEKPPFPIDVIYEDWDNDAGGSVEDVYRVFVNGMQIGWLRRINKDDALKENGFKNLWEWQRDPAAVHGRRTPYDDGWTGVHRKRRAVAKMLGYNDAEVQLKTWVPETHRLTP